MASVFSHLSDPDFNSGLVGTHIELAGDHHYSFDGLINQRPDVEDKRRFASAMAERSLESLASFTRDVGSSCSGVRIIDDLFIAGSKEGVLTAWSCSTGELVWSVEIEGIVADFDFAENTIFITGPNKLFAFSASSGEVLWSQELEGGGDFLRVIGEEIWVSSSVYDIELLDFIESTVHRFGASGELIEKWSFDERPWHFGILESGGILLGLGRPRCGGIQILPDEKPEDFSLGSEDPVTSGTDSGDRYSFGHSDGTVSTLDYNSLAVLNTAKPSDSLVTSITNSENSWISGHQDGTVCFDGINFRLDGSIDFVANFAGNCWASFSKNGQAKLAIICPDGSQMFLVHENRLRNSYSASQGLALGDEAGKVLFFEKEVVVRRLTETNNSDIDQEKRALLKYRLRQLRGR